MAKRKPKTNAVLPEIVVPFTINMDPPKKKRMEVWEDLAEVAKTGCVWMVTGVFQDPQLHTTLDSAVRSVRNLGEDCQHVKIERKNIVTELC